MRRTPIPSKDLLRTLVRMCLSRGLPAEDAEDVVHRSYEKASKAFDPTRGAFEALLCRVVQNECRYWWRTQNRRRETSNLLHLPSVAPAKLGPSAERQAANKQRVLLDALEPEERQVFSAWALQRHLPKGRYPASEASASLGMSVAEFENAKRRLRTKVKNVLDSQGWSPRDLFSVEEDEGPRQRARNGN